MATLYKADGSIEDVTVNGLDDLQKHVGGNIEVVPGMEKNINDKHYLYLVNEEGIIEGLPGNKTYHNTRRRWNNYNKQ